MLNSQSFNISGRQRWDKEVWRLNKFGFFPIRIIREASTQRDLKMTQIPLSSFSPISRQKICLFTVLTQSTMYLKYIQIYIYLYLFVPIFSSRHPDNFFKHIVRRINHNTVPEWVHYVQCTALCDSRNDSIILWINYGICLMWAEVNKMNGNYIL